MLTIGIWALIVLMWLGVVIRIAMIGKTSTTTTAQAIIGVLLSIAYTWFYLSILQYLPN